MTRGMVGDGLDTHHAATSEPVPYTTKHKYTHTSRLSVMTWLELETNPSCESGDSGVVSVVRMAGTDSEKPERG